MSASTLLLVFLEGLLAFISPCILPMLPVYLIYLSGKSTESAATAPDIPLNPASSPSGGESSERSAKPGTRRLFFNTLFFVLGFTLVFLLLGATSTAIGQVLSSHRDILEKVSGAVIILLGIHMTGLIRIPFLNREHRFSFSGRTGGLLSSFLLGIAFSIGWSPCLGPFLGSALLLSSQSATLWEGISLLFVFSLGISVPFLLTSLLFEELTSVFSWFKKHMQVIKIISGSLLILLGLLMLFGWFGYYSRLFT